MIEEIKESSYQEDLINEIVEMIKDNIFILYNANDDALISLRKYCRERHDEEYKSLSYQKLLFFTEEVLAELINCPYIYDFRPLE